MAKQSFPVTSAQKAIFDVALTAEEQHRPKHFEHYHRGGEREPLSVYQTSLNDMRCKIVFYY